MMERGGELETRLHRRLHALGTAGQGQSKRADAMSANTRIVAGVYVRKSVMTIAIVLLQALRRTVKHDRRLAGEEGITPAVMQSLELQVLIAKGLTDAVQFLTQDLGPV